MMRWVRALGLAVLLAVGWLAAGGTGLAHANGENWRIDSFGMDVQLAQNGVATVTSTIDFNFGYDSGHGPYVYMPLRQEVKDPNQWLVLGVKLLSVTSPTGADTAVLEERGSDVVSYRIGTQGRTFTGVQRYVLTFELTGLIAPKQSVSGLDEFNWNAIGGGWQVPIDAVDVRVSGPAGVSRAACWTGAGYRSPCDASQSGSTATFGVSRLSPGEPMQVAAGFPAGTFVGAEQTFTKRMTVENMFPLTPATGIGTLVLSALGYGFVRTRLRRSVADEVYLGMAPGMTPKPGDKVSVGRAGRAAPIAVQFQPPKGARPGELGTLLDSRADNVDVTATILDLAVRGFLVITPDQNGDHTFFRTPTSTAGLEAYEIGLLDTMFSKGNTVTLKAMQKPRYAKMLPDAREGLYKRVVHLGWFRRSPVTTTALLMLSALGVAALGVGIGFIGAWFGWGLLGLSGIIVGLVIALSARKFSARTAEGSAALAQTKGFELYLTTAEANQIKFEEGIDVFSRYLPYAVIFGVTDRWVKVFKDLEQAGVYMADTRWYGGTNFNMFDAWMLSNALNSLTHSMSTAMTSSMVSAATSGTSGSFGGSGFSGGGGFGGGGGGGW